MPIRMIGTIQQNLCALCPAALSFTLCAAASYQYLYYLNTWFWICHYMEVDFRNALTTLNVAVCFFVLCVTVTRDLDRDT